MQIPINELLRTWLPHLGWSTIITSLLSAAWFCFKQVKRFETEWNESVVRSKEQSEQLKLAMENHLPHIQEATERTAAGVERIADVLQEQAVTQARIQTMLETQQRIEH
jgi:hypothetical protein